MQSNNDSSARGSARGRAAVVVGGGIAGLLTARVLTEFFETVTILERTHLPGEPDFRKGTPQDRHPHLMLAGGERILAELFPGLDAELERAGAPSADIGADCVFQFNTGRVPQFQSGLRVRLCSRALWEWAIRKRVVALGASIRLVQGAEVQSLSTSGGAVSGVRARVTAEDPSTPPREETFPADLVAVADGRSSRVMQWLEDLGYSRPEETVVDSHSGYSSQWFQGSPGKFDDLRLAVDFSAPPDRYHGALVLAVENHRYVLVVAGAGGHYPPTDAEGLGDLVKGLRLPLFAEIIKEMKPISPIYGYRKMENRFRHFERMPRWPERLVALGDAAVSLNPVYGQGMTAAATGAMALRQALREQSHASPGADFARRFQSRLAAALQDSWALATGSDYRWQETEGKPLGPAMRLLQKYTNEVMFAMPESIFVAKTFFEVMHGLQPATVLARPAMLVDVLGRSARRAVRSLRRGRASGEPTAPGGGAGGPRRDGGSATSSG